MSERSCVFVSYDIDAIYVCVYVTKATGSGHSISPLCKALLHCSSETILNVPNVVAKIPVVLLVTSGLEMAS